MNFRQLAPWAAAAVLFAAPIAKAELMTYDFAGQLNAGSASQSFTGEFIYDNAATGSTQYFSNTVMEGFRTVYGGVSTVLKITLGSGEVIQADGGNIWVNNITQAEAGAPVPQGQSVQVWTSGVYSNSLNIFNMYLAFGPVTGNFSWDPLDTAMGGNAENLLQDAAAAQAAMQLAAHDKWMRLGIFSGYTSDPYPYPTSTLDIVDLDTTLTGTSLAGDLSAVFGRNGTGTFDSGVFLGTNIGLTNYVNSISSFALRTEGVLPPQGADGGNTVPEPGTLALLMGSLGLLRAVRRRQQHKRRVGLYVKYGSSPYRISANSY